MEDRVYINTVNALHKINEYAPYTYGMLFYSCER